MESFTIGSNPNKLRLALNAQRAQTTTEKILRTCGQLAAGDAKTLALMGPTDCFSVKIVALKRV